MLLPSKTNFMMTYHRIVGCILCTGLLMLFSVLKGQDIVVLNDSTHIRVRLTERNDNEVKYRYFDYQDGPVITRQTAEIAYIIQEDGVLLRFGPPPKKSLMDIARASARNAHPSNDPYDKYLPSRYVKLNFQLGGIVYSSYCNVQRQENPHVGQATGIQIGPPVQVRNNWTVNPGVNLVAGSSPVVKVMLGINYLHTEGRYKYTKGDYSGAYTNYHEDLDVVTKADYLNIGPSIRFTLFRHFHIDQSVFINCLVHYVDLLTGSYTTTNSQSTPPITQTTYLSNSKNNSDSYLGTGTTLSFVPRLAYGIITKKFNADIYLSYNMALKYRLPWYGFGIMYYPFKRLRYYNAS